MTAIYLEQLEQVNDLMNKLGEEYYARLAGNLFLILFHEKAGTLDEAGSLIKLEALPFEEEEKAIFKHFLAIPSIRPVILASLYSRIIKTYFQVNYSF